MSDQARVLRESNLSCCILLGDALNAWESSDLECEKQANATLGLVQDIFSKSRQILEKCANGLHKCRNNLLLSEETVLDLRSQLEGKYVIIAGLVFALFMFILMNMAYRKKGRADKVATHSEVEDTKEIRLVLRGISGQS